MPNNKIAVAKAPVKKYLIEASADKTSCFFMPTITYIGMDKISRPRKNMNKSVNPIKQIAPQSENNNKP